jgi:hypothetical protein
MGKSVKISAHCKEKYTPGWKFTKRLKQIRKIFYNFQMLLKHNYSWEKGNLGLLQ